MHNKTYLIATIAIAIVLTGAACSKKTTNTNTSNTTINENVETVNTVSPSVIPSGNTTGEFTTSTNTSNTNTAVTTATVTITAAGVSPKTLTVSAGTAVTFVNTDTIAHQIASDPYPTHTDLPDFNNTELSQSYRFIFSSVGSYEYHDHLDPTNTAMQGTIIVQ